MNLFKSFNSNLGQYMHKAARPLGSMESSNPCRWRGEWLHHYGGCVCWLFVLLWMDSWCHELIVCKKWYKNNLKMRLMRYFLIHVGVHHTRQDRFLKFPELSGQVGISRIPSKNTDRKITNLSGKYSFTHSVS